jgi:hypothetical protein
MVTRTSVISESKVWFQHVRLWFQHARVWFIQAECDLYRQSAISTPRLRIPHAVWFLNAQMWLRHSRLWFQHAQECDHDTQECDYDTQECDYDTHECALPTHELYFNTIVWLWQEPTKIYVRSPKNQDWVLTSGYTTHKSVILAPCVWF